MKIDFKEFEEARKNLSAIIAESPLVKNEWLSQKYSCNVYLKLENLLPVGSFKLRGATNKILSLSEEEKKAGVLAVSAGNHGQGVAWAARKLGIEAKVIMPLGSPLTKVMQTQNLGAEVILFGENVEQGFEKAQEYLIEHKMTFVHPFKDPLVIAGQGSIGFELLAQIDNMDFVFGSIGGGGLMSGIGSVLKRMASHVKVIGAQASKASSMIQSLQKGELVFTDEANTFADGIKVKTPDDKMYDLLDSVVDEAIHISDDKIALALLDLMEQARIITEGAGALPLAAFDELYKANPKRFKNKNIVLVICGGNIDINMVDRIIEKGLIASKRRATIAIGLNDQPGTLRDLTQCLFECGANVMHAIHDREAPHLELKESIVKVTIEIKGQEHLDLVLKELRSRFDHVEEK